MKTCWAFLLLLALSNFAMGGQDPNEEFFTAAKRGDVAAVTALLDKGVNVNAKTRYGATALSYACDKGNLEVVKLLIDRGADVNSRDTFYGEVPLGWALSKGHIEIIKLLLDKGANGVERVLSSGVESGKIDLVKLAVNKGGITQDTLNNALRRASSGGNREIITLLKEAGASVSEVAVEPEVLKTYVGRYKNEQIGEVFLEVRDGKLVGKAGSQDSFTTYALSKTTFGIVEIQATITFNLESDKVTGFTFKQPGATFLFKIVEQK